MLFVAEYGFGWASLASVVAKRIEWNEVHPEGFRFVGEYAWQAGEPAFRGVAIIEAADGESLHAFALHYGPTMTMAIHPTTDVVSGIAQVQAGTQPPPRARRR